MHTTLSNILTDLDILSRTHTHDRGLLLCAKKTTSQYMIIQVDLHTRRIISTRSFQSPNHAYRDYFTLIASPLNLDRQNLITLLVAPENELLNDSQKPLTVNSIDQSICKPIHTTPQNAPKDHNLTPASFFSTNKVPEWLEGKKDISLLDPPMNIHSGQQYKVLAMHLKPNTRETESTIHLQDELGQRKTISLATACSCFLRGHTPQKTTPVNNR